MAIYGVLIILTNGMPVKRYSTMHQVAVWEGIESVSECYQV